MKLSTERILTTHVGSLPRPKPMLDLIVAREQERPVDAETFDRQAAASVDEVVAAQVASGIDVVSDGEISKPSYTTYVRHRLNGIEPSAAAAEKGRQVMVGRDLLEHPDFAERMVGFKTLPFPGCVGPLSYGDRAALERDLEHLSAAVARQKPSEAFMTAPSPGILTRFVINQHYPSEDAYVEALAEVMRVEYEAIAAAGFILQIDCPDLGSARNNQYRDKTDDEFRRIAERNIAALNAATSSIPPDRMRMHVCWGNYEGPHTHDIPLSKIVDICFRARPQALSFEAANPRHEHEWEDLAAIGIPDDKVLIPGVIDSTTNFVEHPRLIAQRLLHFADLVGQERVIAGADCGFATVGTGTPIVVPSIVWAKFKAMAEGARIATGRLA